MHAIWNVFNIVSFDYVFAYIEHGANARLSEYKGCEYVAVNRCSSKALFVMLLKHPIG